MVTWQSQSSNPWDNFYVINPSRLLLLRNEGLSLTHEDYYTLQSPFQAHPTERSSLGTRKWASVHSMPRIQCDRSNLFDDLKSLPHLRIYPVPGVEEMLNWYQIDREKTFFNDWYLTVKSLCLGWMLWLRPNNSSYSWGRDHEDEDLRSAWANSQGDLIQPVKSWMYLSFQL
jgi:hypothetical protein